MYPYRQVHREFLADAKGIRFKPGMGGQRIAEDGTILIGDRAGPDCSIQFLGHEMSHFVEIDDARMGVRGWGLHFPEVVVYGQLCCEPVTLKMTERELRVLAYQANLLEYLGAPETEKELVRSLTFMPDFCLVPLEDGGPAWVDGKFRIPYKKMDPSRLRWLAAQVRKLRSEYTLERFRAEWDRKLKVLAAR